MEVAKRYSVVFPDTSREKIDQPQVVKEVIDEEDDVRNADFDVTCSQIVFSTPDPPPKLTEEEEGVDLMEPQEAEYTAETHVLPYVLVQLYDMNACLD